MTAVGGCLKEDGSCSNVWNFLQSVRALWPFPTSESQILGLIGFTLLGQGERRGAPFPLQALSDRAFTLEQPFRLLAAIWLRAISRVMQWEVEKCAHHAGLPVWPIMP